MYWVHRNAFYSVAALYGLSLVVLGLAWLVAKVPVTNLLSPFAAVTGLLGAALGLLHQQRTGSSAEYDNLSDKFSNPRWRGIRSRVASSLRDGPSPDPAWWDLFDFFEEIARKARIGTVDVEILYQMFSDKSHC